MQLNAIIIIEERASVEGWQKHTQLVEMSNGFLEMFG